ncbi:hypothetical protein F5Y07DRAFT_276297 [Xylaria sp. FL0933]|nr:hypothetical protein F5Y07DRAFT_276297 [Xylaria sp. FL0933]
MSSRDSSTHSGSTHHSAPVVRQNTFRADRSENHMGELTERRTSHGGSITYTYNHRARGYEHGAPSPTYRDSSAYRRPQ